MQAPAKGTKRRSISYAKWGYIFIAPFFIAFAIFQLIPLASTIYYSFFEYYRSGLKVIGPNFTGLSNYVKLLSLDLPKYLGNTMLMWTLGFVPQIIVSLLLAVWFTDNRLRIRCQPFFKTVIYMPNLIMASAFAMLFFALFADQGPVNNMIQALGGEPVRFLSNIWGTRSLVALMNFLMWFGNTTILLMAAVMGIDLSLFEAAEIDGAGRFQKMLHISLPHLVPLICIFTIMNAGTLISGNFDLFYVIPRNTSTLYATTDILNTYVYRSLQESSYAIGATTGLIQSVVGMFLVLLSNWIVKKISPDNSMF